MFRHILVATDGSALSTKAIGIAAGLAKQCNAELTAIFVTQPYVMHVYADYPFSMPVAQEDFAKSAEKEVKDILNTATAVAAEYSVTARKLHAVNSDVFRGILENAEKSSCDLICMASHGRRGLSAVILGSETTKVLTHSTLPVLVIR